MYRRTHRNSNQRSAHQVRCRLRQSIGARNAGSPSRVQLTVINDKSNVVLELRYEEVARLFTYDRESGVLYWRIRDRNTIRHKYVAGSSRGNRVGYRQVGIKGKVYLEHRIIMVLCFGHIPENAEIDHINHMRDDNRLANLRFVARSENRKNQSVSSKSTTGVTGVHFSKARKKYVAQIKVDQKIIFLGNYNTLEEAAAARAEANLKFNFHNNHGKGRAEYVRKKPNA